MTPEEATAYARNEFAKRGVAVSENFSTNDPPGDHYFSSGGSCHSRVFDDGNYIHFHSSKGAWADTELSKDAPMECIRQMTVNGKDIPEEECWSC